MKDIIAMLMEIKPECDFAGSDDFIMDGLLDSFDIISLTDMLEKRYGIVIDGLDIVPENYASVDAIAGLVRRSGGTV